MNIVSLNAGFTQSIGIPVSIQNFNLQNYFTLPSSAAKYCAHDDFVLWDRGVTLYNVTQEYSPTNNASGNVPVNQSYSIGLLQFLNVVNASSVAYPQFFMAIRPCRMEFFLVAGGGIGGSSVNTGPENYPNPNSYRPNLASSYAGGGGGGGGGVVQGIITAYPGQLFGITVGGSAENTVLRAYIMENNQLISRTIGFAEAGGAGGTAAIPGGGDGGFGGGCVGNFIDYGYNGLGGQTRSNFVNKWVESGREVGNWQGGGRGASLSTADGIGCPGSGPYLTGDYMPYDTHYAPGSGDGNSIQDAVCDFSARWPMIGVALNKNSTSGSQYFYSSGGAPSDSISGTAYGFNATSNLSTINTSDGVGGHAATYYGQSGSNRSGSGGGACGDPAGTGGSGGTGIAFVRWALI